jgi:hexosaminidase
MTLSQWANNGWLWRSCGTPFDVKVNPTLMRLPNFLLVALLLTTAGAGVAAAAVNPEPAIVPAVQQWQGADGSVAIAGTPIVLAAKDEKLLRPTAELLRADLPTPAEIIVGDAPAGKTAIVLTLTDKPFHAAAQAIEEQSYQVDVTGRGVTITAHNRGGIFSGTRSVLQMLASGSTLPCGRIIDGPITRYRFLMLDVGRKAFPIETLYDYLRILGWYKMNALHLHLSDSSFDGRYGGFRVPCDTFPGLASKDCCYTKRQLREFQDRAAAAGIMILPEIDMPGHAAAFAMYWPELAWRQNPYSGVLDVNNPKTIERMKKVLDATTPLFDAPYFHVGTDEYRVPCKDAAERARTGDNFRKFINEINAHLRAKGKQCVVWDGWEHVKSDVRVDPTVVVDMWWGCFDTNAYLGEGHQVINSNQGVSYLTTGRPTYGVNNAGIYNKWQPNHFGRCNPPLGAPGVLGAKLHVWCGQGPSGWTMTEIADQTVPSIVAFSEKMWGRKASPDYKAFLERAKLVAKVPGVTIFNRLPAVDGVVLDQPQEVTLTQRRPSLPLPPGRGDRADLEFPWTLTMEVKKTAVNGRGVILSSAKAEICDSYHWDQRKKVTNPALKEKVAKVTHVGFGVVRAAGNWGPTPAEAKMAAENSRVYGDPLPLGQWVTVAVVATRNHTAVYFDGKLMGQQPQQMICPLRRYGSTDASESFLGVVRKLRVYDRALTPEEIAGAPTAGL